MCVRDVSIQNKEAIVAIVQCYEWSIVVGLWWWTSFA
jgi:hypothetical protein